ncbi:recombinase family protein [Parapedobacter sp. SGR-10]|uniref:recombinase family protein n=1 Tax=Parapedobacter sp. SGR-10 TaxID=2710879 RepID=UPI0013D22B16|nr:recombinase family protein [Parapedobacter sp. SGR-10]NGF55351.1 recombinase family protein [Parapedobacter sp. SGR-10]
MKRADLYIRVSTDEQADKGYSQRDQEERLKRFCSTNKITVGQIIYEDHSAKTFNRPEWIKLLNNLKKKSSKTTLILFTKWDRFSRNAGDAYQMISTLNKLGVEPQAVEQPLDLAIPENKMMLAIYLAAPEVENDRRALNTFYGMRRARKEGRLMGKAPFGYINRSKEDGRKYVALKEPQASAMRWAFNEIAKGVFAADQVRQKMNAQSPTKLSRSAFHVAIRNPLYYGKIFIAKFQDEEAHLVQGQHEPLISEELFHKVQLILDGNKRVERPNTKILSDKNLPLRGFLTCPKCGRNLTGSASKGRTNRYYYYHCIASCGFREQAGNANAIFENGLLQFELNDGIKNILKKLLLDNYKKFVQSPMNEKKRISEEIDRLNARLSVARNKLLSETIDDEEYLDIKRECKEKIERLEEQLSKDGLNTKKTNIDKTLDKALQHIQNIPKLYREGGIQTKRAIIGSIFPEKLEFDGKTYRTARMNVIANHIFQLNNGLALKKNRTNENIFHLSCLVARRGIEPLFQE